MRNTIFWNLSRTSWFPTWKWSSISVSTTSPNIRNTLQFPNRKKRPDDSIGCRKWSEDEMFLSKLTVVIWDQWGICKFDKSWCRLSNDSCYTLSLHIPDVGILCTRPSICFGQPFNGKLSYATFLYKPHRIRMCYWICKIAFNLCTIKLFIIKVLTTRVYRRCVLKCMWG